MAKLSIAASHALQIYNCVGQLRLAIVNLHSMTCCYASGPGPFIIYGMVWGGVGWDKIGGH